MGAQLETTDLIGVDIMAAGVRAFGTGSAPEGDVYTAEDLREMASASNEVADEARPFVKIGHNPAQRLAKASGLYDAAENPATGWMRNFRVEDDKLYCDILRAPKKLAALVESGAFRTRSTEVSPFKSQTSGKSYTNVVRALALLGAKAPAFRTLDDIYALYAAADEERAALRAKEPTAALFYADEAPEAGDGKIVEYAVGDLIWDPEDGAMDMMSDICDLLNPDLPGGYEGPQRFSVVDVSFGDLDNDNDASGPRALVADYTQMPTVYWVVPFTIGDDGEPTLSPSSEWTMAQTAWIEASDASSAKTAVTKNEERSERTKPADTTAQMTDNAKTEVTLDENAVKAFAEALGIEGDVTAEALLEGAKAVAEKAKEPAATEVKTPDGMKLMSEAEYGELLGMAKEGAQAHEQLRTFKRDTLIDGAAREGKLDPAKVEDYKKRYDAAPDLVTEIISELPVQEQFKTAGRDGTGNEAVDAIDERQYAELCGELGIPYIPEQRARREAATA